MRHSFTVLILALVVFACADNEAVRAINLSTGETATFASEETVPEGWELCPDGQTCPTPYPCEQLGESDCLARQDCEAIYEPCSSGGTQFVECRTRPDPNVCAMEGESCTTTGCCGGLECCSGVPIPPGAEYCTSGSCPISDRAQKHAIVPVDPDEILNRVGRLPIATWSYNFEKGVRHMGPMAQDFAASFELGATDRRIFSVDADGVALASIQALLRRYETLETRNVALVRENDELRQRLNVLEKRTARLERKAR